MDTPKFSLNPDAEPFIPNFKKSTAVLEPKKNTQKSEIRVNRIPGPVNMDAEQEDWELSISYLCTIFPDLSEGSVIDVYLACGEDMLEAERMLKKLEGIESSGSENSEGWSSFEASSSNPSNEDSSISKKKP